VGAETVWGRRRADTVMNTAPLEIIVLTYNRAELLRETLRSVVSQTIKPRRIRVVDNGSTDASADVVREHASMAVELVRWPENDSRGCWSRMQAMVEAPWVMLFHDDDLLHPECVHRVTDAIGKFADVSIVLSLMQTFTGGVPAAPELRAGRAQRLSAAQLANRLFRGLPVPFCTAVYRKEALQRCEVKVGTYGKMFDRPLMLDVAAVSGAALIHEPLVRYRLHPAQDSSHRASGPFPQEVIALQALYRSLLGESPLLAGGRAFLRRNWRNLVEEHARMQGYAGWQLELDQFLCDSVDGGGASRRSLTIGRAYAALTRLPRGIERAIRRMRVRDS